MGDVLFLLSAVGPRAPPSACARVLCPHPPLCLCASRAALVAAHAGPACVCCCPFPCPCPAALTPLSLCHVLSPQPTSHTPYTNPALHRGALLASNCLNINLCIYLPVLYTFRSRPHLGTTDEADAASWPSLFPLKLQSGRTQPPRHHPRLAWKHPLHVTPTPRKRPTNHAPPPADSSALQAARRRAAAQHQNNLLPRISAGPGTVTEATHKGTLNLLACKLRPKMALEDTLWIYYGESRTARLADLRPIIPCHIQRAVGHFTIYAVPQPITGQCTHCDPRCAQPCAGALQQPLFTPTYRGGIYLGTVPEDPHPYLLPAADRHHAIPLHLVEHLALGPSPFQKRPPHAPPDGRPPDEPTHATPGPKGAIVLLTLKAKAIIPRDLEEEDHLLVEGLTEHVLNAAMWATASASRLWEDRPSPPLAQAAQDALTTGPTAEDINQILNMRAPPKTQPVIRRIQLVSGDAMDAPPTTTEVHILKHRDIWWTVEWDDHGKVRRAAAHAPDDEVPPPPRGGDRLQLAARVTHTPEAAWEALHYALYSAQEAPRGPLPLERTPAWTRHATSYSAHMRRHGPTGRRLVTWPTNPPNALQEAEDTHGIMTEQVFQLKDTVPTSKSDVPAAREHPVFAPRHPPVQQHQGAPPQRAAAQCPGPPRCEEAQGPHTGQTRTQAKSQAEELDRRGSRGPLSLVRHRYPGAAALRERHDRGPVHVDMGRR